MMLPRGVLVTYETIHQWCRKLGQAFANGLRRRRPRPGDKWHLDEVFIKIHGKSHYLWRAVVQNGNVLDILVTSHRDAKAATRFFRKLLRGLRSVPRALVTDKLASYGVAHRRLMRSVEHRRRPVRKETVMATVGDVDAEMRDHLNSWLAPSTVFDLGNRFARDGFIRVRGIVSDDNRQAVKNEAFRLLDRHAERRDLLLETTGNTPRFMSVVKSEFIAEESDLITTLYRSDPLVDALGRIAGETLLPCPLKDEEFLITRQEKKGDTHGWHWGDFSFALIWIIDTPPIRYGGMLQCVPHTRWDKLNPRVHEYLCANPIATYGFQPGDIYFLRTDTTLHRTVPLTTDAQRIILNLTWAAQKDIDGKLVGDDRWWENKDARAARTSEIEGSTSL